MVLGFIILGIAAVAVAAAIIYHALKDAAKDADKNFGTKPVDSPKTECPPKDKIKLVELVEVVVHKGKETTQAPTGRKQYINLDGAVDPDNPHPEYGRAIKLKARVEWVSGDKSKSLSGQNVYWYSKPAAGNRAGLTGTEKEGFDSNGGATTKSTTTDGKGWTPIVEFHPSQYGGDKFDAYATESKDYKDGMKAGTYEVWRRMYYEIAEMNKASGGKFEMHADTLSKIVASYKDVYVEMQDAGSRDTGTHKENFDTHADGYTWADGYCSATGVPWKVHYSIVDHLCPLNNKEEQVHEINCTAVTQTPAAPRFRPFDFNGAVWLKSAQYKDASNNWVDFPSGKVTRASATGYTKLTIDFTGMGITPTVAVPVKVKVTVYNAPGYNGWGGANLHLVICRGAMEEAYSDAQLITAMAGTGIHEPGHALGLVYPPLAWDIGGSHANHCKHNACVMWWQGYTGRPLAFHTEAVSDPGCHTFVRGKDMTRTAMNPKWKFPR